MKKLTLSKTAIQDLIIEPEVSSKANYMQKLQRPMWPGGISGVTVGFGYDLGMQAPATIERDWRVILKGADIFKLQQCSGKIGTTCRKLLPIDVSISWEQAAECFYKTSLITHARQAANVYPELETLHPYEQTAIVGLVYNRGSALQGDRRREMLALVQAIKDDNDKLMAAIIRQMKRLWGVDQKGLLLRRESEAFYIEKVDDTIPETDKIEIVI